MREVCEYLGGIGNLEREIYASRVADKLKIEKSAVINQANASARRKNKLEKDKSFREMANKTAGIGNKINPERSSNLRASNAEYALLALLFNHQDIIAKAAQILPPEQFVTDFGRRIYSQFIEINKSGYQVNVTLLAENFSETETSEIVRIINSDKPRGIDDFDDLVDLIKSERFIPKPQDASKLTSDELLNQMSLLKKKKT